MNRPPRLTLAFLLALLAPPAARAADPPRPPNVVLIVADDLGARDLGCYGSTFHKTPHLDALAKAGARFTDFYAAAPVGSPTRASILTGRYPQRVNLTDSSPGRPDRPDQQLKQPAAEEKLPPDTVTIASALETARYVCARVGVWHPDGTDIDPQALGFNRVTGGGSADRITNEAEKFIRARKTAPFFLSLSYSTSHAAKPEILAMYKGTPAHGRQSNPAYAAALETLDDAVGRVVKTLADLELTDNTVIIFTSGNGGLATLEAGMPFAPTINTPFREGKGYLYDGGVRVPLLVAWPGVVKPGTVVDQVAGSIDLFPTLCEAAGLKDAKADGVSLRSSFTGKGLGDRALYWHYPHYSNQGGKPCGAVRSGDYKLIEFYEDGRRELFDVRKDLFESRNLIADKPAVAKELAAKLAAWRTAVGATMPTPNPAYTPNPPAKDGMITLPARTATVRGVMLRYEPLPHKNTLGFWVNKDDSAAFEFTVVAPGKYTVEVLQGCGKGSGGAEVELAVGDQALTFTVKDTGGFQAFEAREVGTLTFNKPGRHTLTVRAKTKPGAAVMDLREVVLKPAK